MKQGEVWRVDLPHGLGHVQAGQRPAVIIQNDAATARLKTTLIVPLTSNVTATRFPGTVLIQPTPENGLTMPSVALVFQTRAVDLRALLSPLGTVDDATLDEIRRELVRLVS
jgi:mRNA interferase MazF